MLYDLTYLWNLIRKSPELIDIEKRLVVATGEGRGEREMGEGGEKIQTFRYEIVKSWGCNVEHGGSRKQYCVVELKVSKSVELKSFHYKKKIFIIGW